MSFYNYAKEAYAALGVDTEEAIKKLSELKISIHCWQGDDVVGFDQKGPLSGGIQTTGNYKGRARTPEELMADIDKVLSLVPGKHKINLHACYAIFSDGEFADRNEIEPKHFARWVEFARERGLGLDFNPTFFSHPMVKDGLTLSSPDSDVRRFWVDHGKRCLKIADYFTKELGTDCLVNFWIPDGYKDVPADRMGPRKRFMESLDEILTEDYDKEKVFVALESKVFGIGVESYTVGSNEFCLSYSASRGLVPLMDNGHYHPTEVVSDKIPAILLFNERAALHVTRGVRWDSDHVVLFDDETKEITKEIVRCNALDRVFVATDYFDASINRVAAWVIGLRNLQKAFLYALLCPNEKLAALQNEGRLTELLMLQEELKTYPFEAVFKEFCAREGVLADEKWFEEIEKYEREVLNNRG